MKLLLISMMLSGCASMPDNLPEMPAVQGFAAQPNCVTFCTIHVSIQRAESDVASSGSGAVTGGSQTQTATSTSTQSTADTTTVEPKP